MIDNLYEKAAQIHGHKCPGLAIGVRAAAEAIRMLGIENIHSHSLYCIAENRACYIDGIQTVFGTTLGNGNLEIRPRGKTAFNFYDREAGKRLRLIARDLPEGLTRPEMIAFILTSSFEQVFALTPVHFEAPEDRVARKAVSKCARCGENCSEPFLRMKDGEILCLDCAED